MRNESQMPGSGIAAFIHDWISSSSETAYFLLVLALLLLLSLLIFIWAAFFRKQHRPRHTHHWKYPKPAASSPVEDVPHNRSLFGWWRRHRRRHRKRLPNPTLAETGGLPPARDSSEEPPAAL